MRLVRWERPALEKYRALFRRVGSPWLWFSRLVMADDALAAIVHDPGIAVYAVLDPAGIEVGADLGDGDHRTGGRQSCRRGERETAALGGDRSRDHRITGADGAHDGRQRWSRQHRPLRSDEQCPLRPQRHDDGADATGA